MVNRYAILGLVVIIRQLVTKSHQFGLFWLSSAALHKSSLFLVVILVVIPLTISGWCSGTVGCCHCCQCSCSCCLFLVPYVVPILSPMTISLNNAHRILVVLISEWHSGCFDIMNGIIKRHYLSVFLLEFFQMWHHEWHHKSVIVCQFSFLSFFRLEDYPD